MSETAKQPIMYDSEEYYEAVKDYQGLTELRGGEIVYFASPNTMHQDIVSELHYAIKDYIKKNKGKCKVMISPYDVKLDNYNTVIPDIFVACNPDNFDEKRYNGTPDFIIEVLSTNRYDDLHYKLNLYKDFGVREYWIVDPKFKRTLVYFFEGENYLQTYDFNENIPVNIYKDNEIQLEINIAELLG